MWGGRWDLRRPIPLTDFIAQPLQNWTRRRSEIIGTVFAPEAPAAGLLAARFL
jgi:hypothetical protein